MNGWFIIIPILFIILAVVIIPPYVEAVRKNKSVYNGVSNNNGSYTEFLFIIPYSKSQVDDILSDRGSAEGVDYRYDKEQSIVYMSYFGHTQRYRIDIDSTPDEGVYRLSVKQIEIFVRGSLHMLINPFFINRLNAVPVPFQ